MKIEDKLDMLYGLQVQKEAKALDKQALLDAVIPPEIKARIAEIEAEFADNLLTDRISRLEAEIREEVLKLGASVKGHYISAGYNDGKVTWKTDALEGLIVAYPELAKFKKVGDPYITMRKVAK